MGGVKEVEIFEDEDAVAVIDGCGVLRVGDFAEAVAAFVRGDEVAAIGAIDVERGEGLGRGAHVLVFLFGARLVIDIEGVAAVGADVVHVSAEEGGGHGAGGDDECLDDEGAEDKGEDEGDED